MTKHLRPLLIACALSLAIAAPAAAADEHPGGHAEGRPQQSGPGPGVLSLLPANSVTEHSIDLPGGKLSYTATAGTFPLFDQSGEKSAAIFYTAFVAKPDDKRRPVTFVFNGGPGAASAFLNLGARRTAHRRVRQRLTTAPTCISPTIPTPGSPSPIWCSSIRLAPAGAGRQSLTAAARSGMCAATPSRWRKSLRFTSPTMGASHRPNTFSARAMAASAPSRSRALCKTIRALW